MILIVTLNPLLERRYSALKIQNGKAYRNGTLTLAAGGKGLNISRQLKELGLKSFNFIFSGGSNGKLLREILKAEGLEFSSIQTKSDTREAAIIISEEDKSLTTIFTSNPQVSSEDAEEFKIKLEKMIQNCEIVIFAGSSPSAETDSIIPFGIETANKYDKVSICDTYGRNLQQSIDASPTILHNNFTEIKESLSVVIEDENSAISFLNVLNKKNIKRAFLTNGDKTFYASNFNYLYKVEPLKVNSVDSTGCGDSFVAGLVYSWIRQDVFEKSLKFSTALAACNAKSFDVCNVKLADAEKLLDEVKISPIGKKVKLIDDSPHEI